jgi:protein-serine/threonine kinase
MEIDSSDSGVEQDVAVPVEKFENVENVEPTPSGRSRAESMQLPTTPKGKSSRSQPLNDITPTQATVAPVRQEVIKDRERDPIAEARRERKESSSPAPSDGSKRRPASSNKNRHTIQVEYDGEAAYEKLLEVQEGRAAWARGERVQAEQGKDSPTSTLAPELPKSIEVEQIQDKIEELATELATSPEDYSSTARLTVPSEPSQSQSSTTGTITPLPLPVANAQVHSETPSALPVQPTPPTTSEPPLRVSMAPEPPASRSNSRATATSQKSRTSMPPPALPHIRQPSPSLQEPIPQSAQSSTFGRQTVGLAQPPAASRADRSRKRMSMDKFGLGKLLASANMSTDSFSRTPSRSSEASHAAKLQRAESIKAKEAAKQRQKDSDKATKISRRTTLSLASGSFTRWVAMPIV